MLKSAHNTPLLSNQVAPTDKGARGIPHRRRPTAIVRHRGRLVRRVLLLADMLGLGLAFSIAVLAFPSKNAMGDSVGLVSELLLFLGTLPGWVVLANLHGLYDRDEERTSHTTVDDLVGVFHLVTVGAWLFFAGAWLSELADPYPPKLLTFWGLAICLVVLARVCARSYCRRQTAYVQNTLIVGAGEVGQLLARKFLDHPEYGINLIGFVDADPTPDRGGLEPGRVLGPPELLPSLVRLHAVERVVISFSNDSLDQTLDVVRSLKDLHVQVDIVPRLFDVVSPSAEIHTVEGFPLIGLPPVRLSRAARFVKRALDALLSAIGLVLLAPVLAWIAVRIKLDSPGPIFYRHDRVGMEGRSFNLLKFRTMYFEHCTGTGYGGAAAESEFERMLEDPAVRAEFETSYKLADDPRVTRFGHFLRRTSLDELPQLVNVLLGQMSLIGPRPVTSEELARYGSDVPTLLSFRPGVTGYWQINGRSRTVYEERVRMDIAYIQGWSLKLDSLIFGKTLWVLMKGHGAY